METALATMDVLREMANEGIESSVSDAGVGVLMARAAVRGALLNVQINALDLLDDAQRSAYLEKAESLAAAAASNEAEIMQSVHGRMG